MKHLTGLRTVLFVCAMLLAPCQGRAALCPPGTFSATGSDPCTPCSSGTFTDSSGSMSCTACEAGSYQPSPGSSSCLDCSAGSYQPSTGSTTCLNCVGGTYQPFDGSSACLECDAGFYQPSDGSTACLECAAGSYAASTGSLACDDCSVGTYQPNSGSEACLACDPGTYQAASASTACIACPAGRFQSSSGSSTCLNCSPGTFTSSTGSSVCLNCAAGTFQPSPGSTSCNDCAAGTYQPSDASTTCLNCAPGTFAAGTGSESCDSCTPSCPAGQYEIAACTATSDTGCDACDASCVTCSGPSAVECTSCATGDPPVLGECLPGCTATPLVGCRLPAVAAKSKLAIKDNAVDTKDILKWKWSKGAETALAEFGDPTTTDGYFLCVYDAGERVSSAALPPGGVCAGKPCWKAKSTGYAYKDKELTPSGALSATLKAGAAEKASIKVTGKGANLETPDPTGFNGPIVVQLQRADGAICFEADFSAPFKKNVGGKFSDVSD